MAGITHFSTSADETYSIGLNLGRQLPLGSVVCFFGDLGAGKTTFVKGAAAGILGTSDVDVSSPTFTYLNIYTGPRHTTLYHFDLYRLRDTDDFLSMGFDEMFDAGGVCCIEWAEKIEGIIPPGALRVDIAHLGGDKRQIEIRQL